jgi:class 3 adenylate cyclase/HAMP domain-containing protein
VRIRSKIILVVLPLIITPLVLLGIASFFAARNGITSVATEFLAFKAEQLASYADSQWTALEQNGLAERPEFVNLAKAAVASFARSMVRSPTEVILALEADGTPAFLTSEATPTAEEAAALAAIAREPTGGWRELGLAGAARVAQTIKNESFGWTIVVTESRATFYRAAEQIYQQGLAILGAAALLSILFLLIFSGFLTRPLRLVMRAMRGVIGSTDLSQRVDLLYRDETGELAHTFNLMTGELEQAYGQIKSYALETAIARSREQKVRNIFQKYVPKEVIEQYLNSPESMLKGESRELAVLFSDIRDFTSITERMRPEELVESLNAYFAGMVDVIVSRRGIVDKYMGDCIMAFFGAPVRHADDVWQSVQTGFDMLDTLERFNERQRASGKTPFRIGIGITHGPVTLGNIGSEKKMDYTVIGEQVNLANRVEKLTKIYREPLMITDPVRQAVGDQAPTRPLDRIAVRGSAKGVDVWTARRALSETERKAWALHEQGFALYLARDFGRAVSFFSEVQALLPGDEPSRLFIERCRRFSRDSPPPGWNGVVSQTHRAP